MRLDVPLPNFAGAVAGIETDIAKAVTSALREVTPTTTQELRDQIVGAGLGVRLSRTWRGNVYPESGTSINPAGYIYSKAPALVESFTSGSTVTPLGGRKYLALPTSNVPRAGRGGRRMTPDQVEAAFGQKLIVRPSRKRGELLGFIQAVGAKSGKGWRRATSGRLAQGRSLKMVLMFTFVRSVRMPKLLDLNGPADRWALDFTAALDRNLG